MSSDDDGATGAKRSELSSQAQVKHARVAASSTKAPTRLDEAKEDSLAMTPSRVMAARMKPSTTPRSSAVGAAKKRKPKAEPEVRRARAKKSGGSPDEGGTPVGSVPRVPLKS